MGGSTQGAEAKEEAGAYSPPDMLGALLQPMDEQAEKPSEPTAAEEQTNPSSLFAFMSLKPASQEQLVAPSVPLYAPDIVPSDPA